MKIIHGHNGRNYKFGNNNERKMYKYIYKYRKKVAAQQRVTHTLSSRAHLNRQFAKNGTNTT